MIGKMEWGRMRELSRITNIFYYYYNILYYYTPSLSPSIHPSIQPLSRGWKNEKNGKMNKSLILYLLGALSESFYFSSMWNNVGNNKKQK